MWIRYWSVVSLCELCLNVEQWNTTKWQHHYQVLLSLHSHLHLMSELMLPFLSLHFLSYHNAAFKSRNICIYEFLNLQLMTANVCVCVCVYFFVFLKTWLKLLLFYCFSFILKCIKKISQRSTCSIQYYGSFHHVPLIINQQFCAQSFPPKNFDVLSTHKYDHPDTI